MLGMKGWLVVPVLGVLAAEPIRAMSPMSIVLVINCAAVGVYRGVELWDAEDLSGKEKSLNRLV